LIKIETIPQWGGVRAGAGGKPRPVVLQAARADPLLWYCVRTDYAGEMTADLKIREAGFTVFAPMQWQPAQPARRDGRYFRPARPARTGLLFARYMFAQFRRSDPWQAIHNLPGVDCILGTAHDRPSPMSDQAILAVRGMCLENGCRYPDGVDLHNLDAFVPLEIGSVARFISGSMADRQGICEWSDSERVKLLMSILGRDVRITARRSMVEAV
jgi:transcription antitermination factor NusG